MRRSTALRRVLHGLAIVVALSATVATSQRRWHVEAPEVGAAAQSLDAAQPGAVRRFRVAARPPLAGYDGAHARVTLQGTATWAAPPGATGTAVLRVVYTGLLRPDAQASSEVVLRPGEPLALSAVGDVDVSRCVEGRECGGIVGVEVTWPRPEGRVELAWTAAATASGTPERRRAEPSGDGLLVIEAMP